MEGREEEEVKLRNIAKVEAMKSTNIPAEVIALLALVDSAALVNAAKRVAAPIWDMSNENLESLVNPSKTAKELRAGFWAAVRKAMNDGTTVTLVNICQRAGCSPSLAYQLLKDHPEVVVWLTRPFQNFHESVEPLLSDLVDKVGEIAHLPVQDSRGRVIPANANMVLRVFETLHPLIRVRR